jgi:hypothetical protein
METLDRSVAFDGRAELIARFDEVDLVCTIRYPGEPIQLGASDVNVAALLEGDDDEIERGMRQISTLMVSRLADKVRTARAKGGMAELTLQFEH